MALNPCAMPNTVRQHYLSFDCMLRQHCHCCVSIAAIAKMLNLNSNEGLESGSNDQLAQRGADNILWKVLIFDKLGQDVISSIMRVNDLRENGVTVHM